MFGDATSSAHIPLSAANVRVGRVAGYELKLASDNVSRTHAELRVDSDQLFVVDLNSTNGTYVNGSRITGEREIFDGDEIYFADMRFTVHFDVTGVVAEFSLNDLLTQPRPEDAAFDALLNGADVAFEFCAVVLMEKRKTLAFQYVAKGCHPDLPESLAHLSDMAERLGKVADLFEMIRAQAVTNGSPLTENKLSLVLAGHPLELEDLPRLISGLQALRKRFPKQSLVFEICAAEHLDPGKLSVLVAGLRKLKILLSFGQFSAKVNELERLLAHRPKILSLNAVLTSELTTASSLRRNMIESLVTIARREGARVLGAGISNPDEMELAEQLGVELFEGRIVRQEHRVAAGE